MKINISHDGNELTIVLEGRLDTLTSPELDDKLDEALDGVGKLIFDLSKLEYISSAGLRVLLGAYRVMEEQGEMLVRNPTPAVMEVFEITGFSETFNIEKA